MINKPEYLHKVIQHFNGNLAPGFKLHIGEESKFPIFVLTKIGYSDTIGVCGLDGFVGFQKVSSKLPSSVYRAFNKQLDVISNYVQSNLAEQDLTKISTNINEQNKIKIIHDLIIDDIKLVITIYHDSQFNLHYFILPVKIALLKNLLLQNFDDTLNKVISKATKKQNIHAIDTMILSPTEENIVLNSISQHDNIPIDTWKRLRSF